MKNHIPPERNHFLLFSSIGFLGGCLCWGNLVFGTWIWILETLCIVLGIVFHLQKKSLLLPLTIFFFVFGVFRTQVFVSQPHPEEGNYEITASVCGYPVVKDEKVKITLKNITLNQQETCGKAYATITIKYLQDVLPELFDGARIHFEGKVYLPEGKSGVPHFDYRHWLFSEGYAFAISSYQAYTLENTLETAPVMDLSARIRKAVQERLKIIMGDEASIVSAMLFGDRTGISEEEYDAFRKLGVAHLMSVSGLHIGIVAAMLSRLFVLFKLKRRLRLPILVLFLFGYSALCGFSVSSLRAAIMFSVIFCGKLFLRARDRLSILALAAFIILLINPLEASSAGFVLSFSAMLGIYGFLSIFQELLKTVWPVGRKKIGKGLQGKRKQAARSFVKGFQSLLSVSLGAQIGTILPTIVIFHQLPLYGLIMNLLLVPLIGSILTPFYLCVCLLCFLPAVSVLLGTCASFMTKALLEMVLLLSKLPGAVLRVAVPSTVLIIGLILFLLLMSRLTPGRMIKKTGIAFLVLLAAIGGSFLTRLSSPRYVQLSVGQADCAILMDGRKTIVIDTGENGSELLEYLLYEGRNIDELYITHPHMDHIGGVRKLLDEDIRIDRIYFPDGIRQIKMDAGVQVIMDQIKAKGIPCIQLHSGDVRTYPQTSIHVLWPYEGKVRRQIEANQASMVLSIQFGNYTLLNMGDLDGLYEGYVKTSSNLLKVSHHGSSSATAVTFLQGINPDVAFISCSSTSRSLPAMDTLRRIDAENIPLLRTDTAGDITIILKDHQLLVQPYRGDVLP